MVKHTAKYRDAVADELYHEYDICCPNGVHQAPSEIRVIPANKGVSKLVISHAKGEGFGVKEVDPETGAITLSLRA